MLEAELAGGRSGEKAKTGRCSNLKKHTTLCAREHRTPPKFPRSLFPENLKGANCREETASPPSKPEAWPRAELLKAVELAVRNSSRPVRGEMAMTMKMIVRSKGWRKAVEMTVGKKTGGGDEGETKVDRRSRLRELSQKVGQNAES